jgi:putative lipoic acid-binding regulatory protein
VGRPLSEQSEAEDRARALALLEATHQFPVDYAVSIITVNDEAVVSEMRAAVEDGLPEPLSDAHYQTVQSRGGRYTSHRFKVPCREPQEVLALYDRVRRVKGVITVF